MRRPALALAFAVLVAGAALLVAACGGKDTIDSTAETVVGTLAAPTEEALPEGDTTAGKEVFASAGCGGCHALADAGTTGNVGPNLDESQPDLQLVQSRVLNGAGAMPAYRDTLTDQQIADVSAYVVQATGG
jgi:mono/diheme cytochrome c family protein